MSKIILIFCLVLSLSLSPVVSNEIQQPNGIVLVIPKWIPLFIEKMNKELAEKCHVQGIPFPKIEVEFNPTPMLYDQTAGVVLGYILGMYTYENKTISIYLWGPKGCYFSEAELRHTILHELLHWMDDYRGQPKSPIDHNALFDQRLKELGWI